jgi:hypothetical protein
MKTACLFTCSLLPLVIGCGDTGSLRYSTTFTSPTIGWEAFEKSIRYPELMLLGGHEGYVAACFVIDSLGNADSLTTYSRACSSSFYASGKDTVWNGGELFLKAVVKAIRSTTWTHPPWHRLPANRWQAIDIVFLMKPNGIDRRIIIEEERPVIEVGQ